MKPTLTVIVPVYNGMPFLRETIDSILNQTYQEFRFLIVDDGSTDNSSDYLKTLTDSRVEVRSQSNMGLCASLNRAIESADTELIARLDQDDVALSCRLEEQVNFLTAHPDYACVLSAVSRMTESGKAFGSYEVKATEAVSDYRANRYGCIAHSAICFRRESFLALGGYRPVLYPVDDYDLLLRFEENYKVAVINRALIKYRIHSQAGTFKTFYDMDFKTRYVEAMAARRRSGKPEISLTEFNQILQQAPVWERWQKNADRVGRLMFRKAGLMIGEAQYIGGVYNLVGSFLLAPKFVWKRLLALYRSRSQSNSNLQNR